MTEQEAAFYKAQMELHQQLVQAQRWAQERQYALDTEPKRQHVIIAAVDAAGGYSKCGEIPWDYPEDLKWFKQQTSGHVCVMGKTTYLDLVKRLGDRAKDSVLPNRRCFVISSTLDQSTITNATVLKSIYDIDMQLTEDDVGKTIFYIGGGRIFQAALSVADRAMITVINQTHDCDSFFPHAGLTKLFVINRVTKGETDDLRFVEFIRK